MSTAIEVQPAPAVVVTPAAILCAAADLIEREGWCQGQLRQRAESSAWMPGEPLPPIVGRCAMGAIVDAGRTLLGLAGPGDLRDQIDEEDPINPIIVAAIEALGRAVPRTGREDVPSVMDWNDHPLMD